MFCHLVRLTWGWRLGFFCPILEGIGVSQGLLRLPQLIVQTAKSHVLEQQEQIPVQGLGCWQCRVIILYLGGMVSCFCYLKRCLHPWGEFLDVILAGNFLELLPPCWHFHMLCTPVDPLVVPLGEDSGIKVHWGSSSSLSLVQGTSPPVKNSWTPGSRAGRYSRSSSSIVGSGWDQSEGSSVLSSSPQAKRGGSLALTSSPGLSSKVTCHLNHTGLGDWAHLLDDYPWHASTWRALFWWLPAEDLCQWLPKHLWCPEQWWPQLNEWLNLSILSSSSAMATSAHQWASLTTAKASSQEPHVVSLSQS